MTYLSPSGHLLSPDGVLGTHIFVFPYCPNTVRTALASSNHVKYITQAQQPVCLHSLRGLKPLISTFLRKNLQGIVEPSTKWAAPYYVHFWVTHHMGFFLLCPLDYLPHGHAPYSALQPPTMCAIILTKTVHLFSYFSPLPALISWFSPSAG